MPVLRISRFLSLVHRKPDESHDRDNEGSSHRGFFQMDGLGKGREQVGEQADGIIGNGHHRQAFHRFLQADLKRGPPIHLGQQLPVLIGGSHLYARAQQFRGVGGAKGHVVELILCRTTGTHAGHVAPLHEFGKELPIQNALFAQKLDALHDQVFIGATGIEA